MKKTYDTPFCRCVMVSTEDLIRTSGGLRNLNEVNADSVKGISFSEFLNSGI